MKTAKAVRTAVLPYCRTAVLPYCRTAVLLGCSLLASVNAYCASAAATLREIRIEVTSLDGGSAGFSFDGVPAASLFSWLSVGTDSYLLSTGSGPMDEELGPISDRDYQGTFNQTIPGQFATTVQSRAGDFFLSPGWSATAVTATSTPTFASGGSAYVWGAFRISGRAQLVLTATLDVTALQADAVRGESADATAFFHVDSKNGQTAASESFAAIAGQNTAPGQFQFKATFSNTGGADFEGYLSTGLTVTAYGGGTVTPVPEAASAAMLAVGLLALAALAPRRGTGRPV